MNISLVVVVLALVTIGEVHTVPAAGSYTDPAFKTQWTAGEAITPNFWGPLDTVRDGKQEPYNNGTRVVEYFDKGRMERDASGNVTNGLLATELIGGKVQTGDATFDMRTPAAIPVAGDSDNPGPTYAQIQANAAPLMVGTKSTPGVAVTQSLNATGVVSTTMIGAGNAQVKMSGFDMTTQHNLPKAFADYRAMAGVTAIGLAISEPFWSNVKVGGQPKDVLVQAFERRVLTYTPTNPAAFKVEMGNIGQHYYQWRYVLSPPSIPSPIETTPTGTPPAVPRATRAAIATPPVVTSPVAPVTTNAAPHMPMTVMITDLPTITAGKASASILTTPGASCTIIAVQNQSIINDPGLMPKTADGGGRITWTWQPDVEVSRSGIHHDGVTVACALNGETARASTLQPVG